MYKSLPELIDSMIFVLLCSLNPEIIMDKLNIDQTFKTGDARHIRINTHHAKEISSVNL